MKDILSTKMLLTFAPNSTLFTSLPLTIGLTYDLFMLTILFGSKYSVTEIATLISVSALEKSDLHDLITTPSDKLLKENQKQNVKELTLID